jgi:chromosome segregation ATPase
MTRDDRLAAVRLARFRGATRDTEITFDPSKPVVLLVGENGTGKSSLVDAIDAVCNGSRGSIDDRSSTTPRHHLPSAGARAEDVELSVRTGRGEWSALLKGDKLVTLPAWGGPPVHVLRRAGLVRLVDAQPGERYEVIERFIDVSQVEACETALAAAARDAATAAKGVEAALAQADRALEELWIGAERPLGSAETWARAQDAEQLDALHAQAERANAVAQAAERLGHDHAALADAARQADDARAAAADARHALDRLERAGATRELATVLREAERLLAAGADACPVCERPVDAAAVRARLAERLGHVEDLAGAVARLESAERGVRAAETSAAAAAARRLDSARQLAGLLAIDRLDAALRDVATRLREGAPDDDDPAALAERAGSLRDLAFARAGKLQRQIGHAEAVGAAYDQVCARRDELHDARAMHERLNDVLLLVRRERTAYVQEVLDAVRDECNRLYETIHPDEGLRLGRLRLDEKRRRSLHQDAAFGALADVPPQAYYSESHLDTLGFCFWLAATMLAAARDGVPPIVVLDDVLASVDAAHAARLLALLVAERSAFAQLVVATHQRAWLDAVRADVDAAGAVDVVELGAWTPETGIRRA